MAEYVQTAGGTVVLPDYSRPDLAFTETRDGMPATNVNTTVYKAQGLYFDVILDYTVQMRTDVNAGDRVPVLQVEDELGNPVVIAAVAAGIPASQIANLHWSTSVSVAYSVTSVNANRYLQTAFPLLAMLPGWSLVLVPDGAAAGDTFGISNLTLLHVPTGPKLIASTVTAASPVLV